VSSEVSLASPLMRLLMTGFARPSSLLIHPLLQSSQIRFSLNESRVISLRYGVLKKISSALRPQTRRCGRDLRAAS
jgi:hypothetical protein